MSQALALDAADGKIDGRYFGRPIVQAGGATLGGYTGAVTPYSGLAQTTYGGYGGFGGGFRSLGGYPTVVGGGLGGASYLGGGYPTTFGSFGTTSLGGFGGYPTLGATSFGGASSQALALDAADGKIDGQYFGRPIVQRGGFGGFTGGYPSTFGGFGATTLGGFGGSYLGGLGATSFGGASSNALALDAADGKIDGQYFGRPIVQAGSPSFTPSMGYGGGIVGGGYTSTMPAFGGIRSF
eukprot:NODE_266_length_1051_cov_1103.385281_g259_i0.p1 GENE.NODE_266_length_1051_cov_1103.385281_g259_i0~~NODE_266_length_1051_cov_1103.385281_g259_i0.p1  ORF type:complete len:264 (-),score=150.72 NODE_266_length_1051_cov_1103.385281_g259_i0:259-975(-)